MPTIALQHYKRGSHYYASIIETFRDPVTRKNSSRTLEALGDISEKMKEDPNYLQSLKDRVTALRSDASRAEQLQEAAVRRIAPAVFNSSADASSPRLHYGMAPIRKVWEKLGLNAWFRKAGYNRKLSWDLDLAVFYQVASRILSPLSRRGMRRQCPRHLFKFDSVSLDHHYEALDILAASKPTIIKKLDEAVCKEISRDCSLVFYDVTTFYFESFEPDCLRERGMSKEHRTHETQVLLGLLIDRCGIPLDYEIYRGNTAEVKTLMKVVESFREKCPQGKPIVVADRGLNSKDNLSKLIKNDCAFIVAHSLQRLSSKELGSLFSEDGWKYKFDSETGEMSWKMKTMDCPDAVKQEESQEAVKPRLIVTWSAKRYAHDMKELNLQWEQAKKMASAGTGRIDASFKRGSRQFLKRVKQSDPDEKAPEERYELNRELYERKIRFAGYYGLITCCEDLSDEEIYSRLRELWKIENCFRVMKSVLCTRPIYVRTEAHIRGHFVVCVLALALERFMAFKLREQGIEYSAEMMVELLMSPTVSPIEGVKNKVKLYLKTGEQELEKPESSCSKSVDLNQEAEKVMAVFGVEPLPTLTTVVDITKRLGVRLPI